MSQTTTLAELSLSLNHVQSLLKQITDEVQVLTQGIAVLVEQEEAADLEAELEYLDVDPWSKVNDKDKKVAVAAHRQDSIRSLLQRRPSTLKDETKALARILSQKRTGGAGSGSETEKQQQATSQQQVGSSTSKWSTSNLQEQVIDEDAASSSSEGSARGLHGRSSVAEKQELDYTADQQYTTINSLASLNSNYGHYGGNVSPSPSTSQPPEAERVPHTITVQTNNIPKYSLAISKANTSQNPSTPVLTTSASQGSILGGAMTSPNGATGGPPPFWRSSTVPNTANLTAESLSRPSSQSSNFSLDGQASRGMGAQNTANRRSLQPTMDMRSSSDSHVLTQANIKDRYSPFRSPSQSAILHQSVGREAGKAIFTVNTPPPQAHTAAQVEKTEAADCFSKLGLNPELLRGIYAYGLKMPSFLQQRGIPMIMSKHDVLAQAKPEVAKTLTYAIPLLHFLTLPATSIHPQLIILCSNHDLCLHVQRVLLALARFMPTISCLICAEGSSPTLSLGTISSTPVHVGGHGGEKNGYQRVGAPSGPNANSEPLPVIAAHVVIGTPGKVLNLIRTKQISIAALKVMVLENADILLISPLKEATVSLLAMVREGKTNGHPSTVSTSMGSSGSLPVSAPLISPPNSGPTSPVSMAVAALNGRIMNTTSSSAAVGALNRYSASYGEESKVRPGSINTTNLGPVAGSTSTSSTSPGLTTNGSAASGPAQQPQLLFFSTVVPPYVLDYVSQYLLQPSKALVRGHDLALKGILQFFKYMTVEDEEWRLELLCELLEDSGANRTVVFCNGDGSVEKVVRKIRERKGSAVGLYTDMDMQTKKAALLKFRGMPATASLVMTDRAAKELDILAVPLVVSFEIPNVSNYIPRVKWIDRSGGKVGVKVNLVDGLRGEGQALRAIQQQYRTTIDDMPVSISEFITN